MSFWCSLGNDKTRELVNGITKLLKWEATIQKKKKKSAKSFFTKLIVTVTDLFLLFQIKSIFSVEEL